MTTTQLLTSSHAGDGPSSGSFVPFSASCPRHETSSPLPSAQPPPLLSPVRDPSAAVARRIHAESALRSAGHPYATSARALPPAPTAAGNSTAGADPPLASLRASPYHRSSPRAAPALSPRPVSSAARRPRRYLRRNRRRCSPPCATLLPLWLDGDTLNPRFDPWATLVPPRLALCRLRRPQPASPIGGGSPSRVIKSLAVPPRLPPRSTSALATASKLCSQALMLNFAADHPDMAFRADLGNLGAIAEATGETISHGINHNTAPARSAHLPAALLIYAAQDGRPRYAVSTHRLPRLLRCRTDARRSALQNGLLPLNGLRVVAV